MKVDPVIAARHYEAAALEQTVERLRAEGYEVEHPARFEGLGADLVARRGGKTIVYEFVVPGSPGTPGWAEETNALRTLVAERGGRFRLVLVRPPRETRVEVAGLEEALARACEGHAGLGRLSAGTVVREVGNVALASVQVGRDGTRVSGEATVRVELFDADDESFAEEDFPLEFDLVLDRDGNVASLDRLDVEIPSWWTPQLAAQ
jgi:hypothetical protein